MSVWCWRCCAIINFHDFSHNHHNEGLIFFGYTNKRTQTTTKSLKMKGEVRLEICSHKFDACLEMNLLIAFLFADRPRARIMSGEF